MGAGRIRYIGNSVVLTSATKCSPFRNMATRIVVENFRTHGDVLKSARTWKNRRITMYRKMLGDLYQVEPLTNMIGRMPVDFKGCFTVGGSSDHMDDQSAEQLFDCVLEASSLEPAEVFSPETAMRFREEAVKTVRLSIRQIELAITEMEKEDHIFELDEVNEGDRLYTGLKKIIDDGQLLKDEIKTMAYSVTHAAFLGIEAVYVTGLDAFSMSSTKKKAETIVRKVLEIEACDCPEISHLSDIW